MIIFINNKSAKFCQITLRTKRFIHKKVVPFFCLTVLYFFTTSNRTEGEKLIFRSRRKLLE